MAWLACYGNDPDMTRDTKNPDKARARKPAAVFERARGGPARAIADLVAKINSSADAPAKERALS